MGYKGPKSREAYILQDTEKYLVYNVQELSTIDPNTQAVRIAHTVGKRKRALIIAEAKKLKLKS